MALIHAQKITIIDDVLVHHTKYLPAEHDATAATRSVSNSRESNWDNFYEALIAMKGQMQKWGIYNRFKRDYVNYFLNFSLWHLTTLTGPAYFKLFDKLKNSWLSEVLGKNHKPDFFYNDYYYNLYSHMLKMSAEEFLFFIKQQESQKVSDLEWHNQNLQRDLGVEQNRIHNLEDDKNNLLVRIRELEKEITDIKNSTAWKVGRAATIVPRRIKKTVKTRKK